MNRIKQLVNHIFTKYQQLILYNSIQILKQNLLDYIKIHRIYTNNTKTTTENPKHSQLLDKLDEIESEFLNQITTHHKL